jgi:ethanolamine ammonia-lyase large subunit
MDNLIVLLATAGLSFMMGIPGADDIMLNYQSTSFHDQLFVRETLGKGRAPEFEKWLQQMGMTDDAGRMRAQPVSRLMRGIEQVNQMAGLRHVG